MVFFLDSLVALLVMILLLGLIRIIRGPSYTDRLLATQLFSTTGVAITALLSVSTQTPSLLNVALVLALLTSLTLITFSRIRGAVK
jgi:multicomponent Na+:H+ antiporter subunit F